MDLDLDDELDAAMKRKEAAKKKAEQAAKAKARRGKRNTEAEAAKRQKIGADLKKLVLAAGEKGCEEIVFIEGNRGTGIHYYENLGTYYCNSANARNRVGGKGSAIKRLNLRDGSVKTIYEDPEGYMCDLRVHYSGKRLIFGYRKAVSSDTHLYEINVDGSGLRRITDGPWVDIEPCYLPNGDIVFSSNRCKRWVPCWNSQVATIFRCSADGSNIVPLSSSPEMENTPFMLPDGRVLYTRWEYTDRSQMVFHHLWAFNPDGTGLMVYYGNEHPGGVFIDGMPIPGTRKVLFQNSPGHGRGHRTGMPTLLDPLGGPSDLTKAKPLIGFRERGCEPCPITDELFLFIKGGICLLDKDGRWGPIYGETGATDARPLRPRKREPIIPERVNWKKSEGTLILADAHHGRNMKGVRPGEIKKLLIFDEVPKPVNFGGGRDNISLHGSYMLHRLIGTVPVEEDGSAYFRVPALRSLFFVALDKNDLAVKRMQSFVTVMPGDTMSCVGCHEQRYENPRATSGPVLEAVKRPPSVPEYPKGVPDVICFARDVQPVLDRHCLRCHDIKGKRAGNVTLNGDRGSYYANSFLTLWAYGQLSDGQNGFGNQAPRTIGTAASPLMKKIDGSHHGVKLPKRDHDLIRLWIDASCVYAGTYATLGSTPVRVGSVFAPPPSSEDDLKNEEGELDEAKVAAAQDGAGDVAPGKELADIMRRRCSGCHGFQGRIYRGVDGSFRHVMTIDKPNARYNKELLYSLTRPELSRALLAPLARDAGGWGLCKGTVMAYPGKPVGWRPPRDKPTPKPVAKRPPKIKTPGSDLVGGDDDEDDIGLTLEDKSPPVTSVGKVWKTEEREIAAVFADRKDPDYIALLSMIKAAKGELERRHSFEIPGYRPNQHYVREMIRFGILPKNYEEVSRGKAVDPYVIDQAYWRSFWWPQSEPRPLKPGEFLVVPKSAVAGVR